jgi:predicted ATPase
MLQTVAVRGYRSLREVVLPLGRLSIVTGANGTGKSSVYRALCLLADCGRGEVIGSLAREGGLQSVLWAGPEQLGGARRAGKAQGTARTPRDSPDENGVPSC